MAVHNLSNGQMAKFLGAVGAGAEIPGGEYTTRRLRFLATLHGGLEDWPSITDDPKVNFAVDCVGNTEELTYNALLYESEVAAFRTNGAFG